MSTPLSSSAYNINSMWEGIHDYNYDSNISLMASENTVGLYSSLPSQTQLNSPNYPLSYLSGFSSGIYGTREENECRRTLQDGLLDDSTLANTHIITYSSNYVIRSLMSGTTRVYKNGGTLLGTITTARGTLNVSSMALGDIITFDKPAVIYNSTYPGMQGSYCGYAGYCFATRRDRYTKTIKITNISPNDGTYELLYTATGDSNVTSLTSLDANVILSGETISLGTFTSTGQYFIQTSELCTAWIGEAPTKDSIMLYPMTAEIKYGFFSTNGHVLATNNAESARQNTGGGQTIAGIATDGGTANIITSLGTGKDNAYGSTSVVSTLRAGNYYSGDACAIYCDSSASATTGTIFTAESQGDGTGGEMTTFTAASAHARGACSGGGAAWVAVVGAGFSGSTPTYPLYADVIMRFNYQGVFQDAESFSGTTTSPQVKKAYWGNGAGTGIYFTAGDFFWANVPVQGYQDTDTTDKDETNMVMTDFITLPSPTAYTFYAQEEYQDGWGSSTAACTEDHTIAFTVWSPSTAIAAGAVLFETNNTKYNDPWNGSEEWYWYSLGRAGSVAVQVGYNGIILDVVAC